MPADTEAHDKCMGRPVFGWLARGRAWRMLFVPAAPFVIYVATLEAYLSPTEMMDNWAGTAGTFTLFLVGFIAAKNEDFWSAIDHALPASIGLSLVLGGL